MADITTKMSVTGLSQYKKAMGDAAASVKTLDEELKLNEEQLKLNGNQELYMANKVKILKDRIEAQKKVVSNAEAALKAMRENGVDPSSKSFQQMQQKVYSAATKLTSMRTELRNVESGAEDAKKQTSGMNEELQKVGKGIAWQNVTSGLKEITSQLQSGARAAVQFGKKVAKSAMDSTEWADDVLTRATKYGVDAETVQRMDNVAEYIDTDVDTIIAAQTRLAKNKGSLVELLGIDAGGMSIEDAFWAAGKAISSMTDEWEQEEAAQKVFGRGWKELLPLFEAGQDKYNQLMEEQTVLSNENVKKLGEADDAIKSIQQQIELMKNQFWADNADKIIELLQWIIDNKDGIITALEGIGIAFGALKIAEFAGNVMKAVDGMRELLGLGGKAAAEAGSEAAASAGSGAGGGFFSTAATAVKDFFIGGAGTPLAVVAAAIAPALIAQNETWAKSEETRASRAETASKSDSADAQFLAAAAEALVLRAGENQDFQGIHDLLKGLESRQNQQRAELYNTIQKYAPTTSDGNYTWNQLMRFWAGEELDTGAENALLEAISNAFQGKIDAENAPKVTIEPEVDDDAAADIAAQIGTVSVPVQPKASGGWFASADGSHANGLPWVPYDGYLGILHRGERILTANQNKNYTYNNNTYFGSVNLHNGLEVDALAESIARNNKRKSRGYGS